MAATSSVRLVVPSEVRYIDLVHCTVEKLAEAAGLGEDDALNVGLAVREAVINAMIHGNRRDPNLPVDVTLRLGPRALIARICDHGNGFDPEATADPRAADNLLRTSGRGLLLIRAFVDDVKFRRTTKGMELTLTKRVGAAVRAKDGHSEAEDSR